jgi:hypothetical protein
MTTGRCSECSGHFNLLPDGRLRMHGADMRTFCGGSLRPPAPDPSPPHYWSY